MSPPRKPLKEFVTEMAAVAERGDALAARAKAGGKVSLLDVLKATGVKDPEKVWNEVKANLARLDACPGPHAFEPITRAAGSPLMRRYRCERCQGEVEAQAALWYQRGLEQGRLAGIAEGGEGP